MAKRFIWYMIICGFVFSIIIVITIHLPSPSFWNHQTQYDMVLGRTLRITCDATIGILLGSMLNLYLLTKWKRLVKGRYFMLRNLGASVTGELTQYVVVLIMMYYNLLQWHQIAQLIVLDYTVQVIFLVCTAPLAHFLVFLIRRIEGEDTLIEQDLVFNPFVLKSRAQRNSG